MIFEIYLIQKGIDHRFIDSWLGLALIFVRQTPNFIFLRISFRWLLFQKKFVSVGYCSYYV